MTIVLTNLERGAMFRAEGEFTGSGTVEMNDLTTVLANYGLPVAEARGSR